MNDFDRPRRVNGLSPPYTAAQLSTWVFLPTLVLEFLFFVSPILPVAASIPCTIVFFGLAVASAYYGVVAMKTDPADPRLKGIASVEGVEQTSSGTPRNRQFDPTEPTKQCWICDVQVGEKSMHCKFCNKCVENFDHHCMWLNTCVGKANYDYFYRTMLAITALLTVHSSIQLALVIDIYIGTGASKARAQDWFHADATIVIVVIMCVFLLFDLAALSLIVQLLLFHIRLQRQGLSTYQYIVRDNQIRRERTKKENELNQKRQAAMVKAKEEGKKLHFIRLKLAGSLRKNVGITCCDPIQDTEKSTVTKHTAVNGNAISNGNGHRHAPTSTTIGRRSPHELDSSSSDEAKEPEDQ